MASMERGGFEPPKAYAGRFTVCSLWPLGHLSATGAEEWTRGADGRSRTDDLLITSQLLYLLSYIGRRHRAPAGAPFVFQRSDLWNPCVSVRRARPSPTTQKGQTPNVTKPHLITSDVSTVNKSEEPRGVIAPRRVAGRARRGPRRSPPRRSGTRPRRPSGCTPRDRRCGGPAGEAPPP